MGCNVYIDGRGGMRPVGAARFVAVTLAFLLAAGANFQVGRGGDGGTVKGASPAPQKGLTNSLGMTFVRIEPGAFVMGSPESEPRRNDDETRHKVTLTKTFYLGARHVTRGQFAAFVADARYTTDAERHKWVVPGTGEPLEAETVAKMKKEFGASFRDPGFPQADDHPVVNVSWNDARAFCGWLSRKEGRRYRLPTEAEWEYAARAGTTTTYFWGDDPDGGAGFANCADLTLKERDPERSTFNWRDGFAFTSPVGSFRPNPSGLYDMIGNAEQWCEDGEAPYPAGGATDPRQEDRTDSRIYRGGSWHGKPIDCRVACRGGAVPGFQSNTIGFRVVLDPH